MDFVTVKKLQGEFGLSFATAERIIHEHRRQAWKRYWPLSIPAWLFLLASVAPEFANHRLPHHATLLLSLAALALVGLHLYLMHRASREPILVAARARSAKTPSSDTAMPRVV